MVLKVNSYIGDHEIRSIVSDSGYTNECWITYTIVGYRDEPACFASGYVSVKDIAQLIFADWRK